MAPASVSDNGARSVARAGRLSGPIARRAGARHVLLPGTSADRQIRTLQGLVTNRLQHPAWCIEQVSRGVPGKRCAAAAVSVSKLTFRPA
jgi:hypothetical protein